MFSTIYLHCTEEKETGRKGERRSNKKGKVKKKWTRNENGKSVGKRYRICEPIIRPSIEFSTAIV
jgi:hypothetical protein